MKSELRSIEKRDDFQVSSDDGDVPTSEEPHKDSINQYEGDLRQTFALQRPLSKSDRKLLANCSDFETEFNNVEVQSMNDQVLITNYGYTQTKIDVNLK